MSDHCKYNLNIDGPIFRCQREILIRLANDRNYTPSDADIDLIDGLIGLTDEIADQAHDIHGIDCLLSDPESEDTAP